LVSASMKKVPDTAPISCWPGVEVKLRHCRSFMMRLRQAKSCDVCAPWRPTGGHTVS
jgi:hypothetical protein